MLTKKQWRASLLTQRNQLMTDPSVLSALACAVRAMLAEEKPADIGFYWPIRGEPDLREVLLAYRGETGAELWLPETFSDGMIYRPWIPEAPMKKDCAGIRCPDTDRSGYPGMLLCPCVGFSEHGHRLGYGGGYFDRYLSQSVSAPVTVGIALDELIVPPSLFEVFDRPLDIIITQSGCLRTKRK